jgi:hypothetical protein
VQLELHLASRGDASRQAVWFGADEMVGEGKSE